MAYSSEAEYVGFEFCSSSESANSIEERMLTAEDLFYDGKLRPLGKNYEWRAPIKQKAGDACAPNAEDPSSPTLSNLPSMADAAAQNGPEAGRFGPLLVGGESTDLFCADEVVFNSSDWICFSSPSFCIEAETDRKSEDTENMGVSGHFVEDSYLHPRSWIADERTCLSPLSTNRSLHARAEAEQGAKTNKQSLPNAGIKQAMAENFSSNHSLTQAMAVARARRLMNVNKGRLKLGQSDPAASTAQVCCLLTSTSTSSSSSSSLTSTCSSTTCGSFSSRAILPSSSSSPSALVSSLLFALSSAESSTFLTSPSSPPFSPFTSTATPSSPPFSPFTTSSMPSSASSSSSSLFPNLQKKHPLLSSPSSRSTHCSCSCRFPLWSLWPFSRYKESIYSYLQNSQYVSLRSQESGSKKDGCIASRSQYSSPERKQMRRLQHTKAVIAKTSSIQTHPSFKYVNSPVIVSDEQRGGGDSGQMGNCDSDGNKGSTPTHATRAKKMALSGDNKVMHMGFQEYTRKRGPFTPTVRVTPILSIVPGCMGPSLSKTRPKATKTFM